MAVQAPSVRRHRVLFDMKMLRYNYELASHAKHWQMAGVIQPLQTKGYDELRAADN